MAPVDIQVALEFRYNIKLSVPAISSYLGALRKEGSVDWTKDYQKRVKCQYREFYVSRRLWFFNVRDMKTKAKAHSKETFLRASGQAGRPKRKQIQLSFSFMK